MKEILITSTVLIPVILLLRRLFRNKVSQRLIYAAWLLVALRLLVPIQLGQSAYSVITLTQTIEEQSQPIQQVQQAMEEPMVGPSREELYEQLLNQYIQQGTDPESPEVHQQIEILVEEQLSGPTLWQILTAVWVAGMAVMGVWFLIANLHYLRRAKSGSVPFPQAAAPVPVRVSPHVSTPCLVGLFRPVIYLTPESTASAQSLNHVLTHEVTHLRHGDHIWSLVRCVCLCVYWFDPLVWIAALQSRRDCELACDESALKRLGDTERIAYGKTLLATVTPSSSPAHLLETATAMNETKKQLKERVCLIVKKPKTFLIAAICLILITALTAGCAFAGGRIVSPNKDAARPTDTTQPIDTTQPTTTPSENQQTDPPIPVSPADVEALFDNEQSWYRMALTGQYTDPRHLIVGDFFARGFEDEDNTPTQMEWDVLQGHAGFKRDENLRRLPVKKMNAVLEQCFGLSISDLDISPRLVYLKQSDCYFVMAHGENVVPDITITSVVPGTVGSNAVVYYTNDQGDSCAVTVSITQRDGTLDYRIVSNQITHQLLSETISLAGVQLGMSYPEFLYAANQVVLGHLENSGQVLDQATKDMICQDIYAIKDRSLYLLSDKTLMMQFRYVSLAETSDPLYGVYTTEFDLEKYGWEAPVDLETESYRWLFDLEAKADGFYADSYGIVMADVLFAEPDVFVAQLSRWSPEFIDRLATLISHSLSAEELNPYLTLLTYLDTKVASEQERATIQSLRQAAEETRADTLPEYQPGSIKLEQQDWHFERPYRTIYYQLSGVFWELLTEEEQDDFWQWIEQQKELTNDGEHMNEMKLVSFIKRYNITREEFDYAVGRMVALHSSSCPGIYEDCEIPNGDIIYTFDNEIINHYYRYA